MELLELTRGFVIYLTTWLIVVWHYLFPLNAARCYCRSR
jgi:hypothetical protein